jgi:hypothetical protein
MITTEATEKEEKAKFRKNAALGREKQTPPRLRVSAVSFERNCA